MHGEIDEDVDVVFADQIGGFFVIEGANVLPAVGASLDADGEIVGGIDRGVAEDFEGFVVVVGEEREHESADSVGAEVGRDVADAETAVGIAIVFVRADQGFQRRGKFCGPDSVLGQ